MTMRGIPEAIWRPVLLAIVLATTSTPAYAQPQPGVVVSGSIAAAVIDSSIEPAFTGGIGYRMNGVFSIGVEAMVVPTLDPSIPEDFPFGPYLAADLAAIGLYAPPRAAYQSDGGSATMFTTNIRLDIPTTSSRLTPYVAGGGGVAAIRERIGASIIFPPFLVPLGNVGRPQNLVTWSSQLTSRTTTSTSINLALTLGGGLSIHATDRFAIDVDLRYVNLTGSRDRHIGRFGAGVSYRWP
jgi:hypothetical protein